MRISVVEMVLIHKHVNIHIYTKNVHIDHIIRYWVCTTCLPVEQFQGVMLRISNPIQKKVVSNLFTNVTDPVGLTQLLLTRTDFSFNFFNSSPYVSSSHISFSSFLLLSTSSSINFVYIHHNLPHII